MATVIFDFDSTLITLESLEEILAARCALVSGLAQQIAAITDLGMEGKINFQESLTRRLALAAPHRDEVIAFGHRAISLLTPGMSSLINRLQQRGVDLAVVSGGLREAICPLANALGIGPERVHAVSLLWSSSGEFAGIDPSDPFSVSKAEGAAHFHHSWSSPSVAVGDGKTDHDLFRLGYCSAFIAFTANVRREAVVALGSPEARNVSELSRHLEDLLS